MRTVHQKGPGGRGRVRRAVVSIAVVCAGLIQAHGLEAADDPKPHPGVTVCETRGVYSVTARFQVPQPPAAVLAVLTDYDQIPRFMPGVQTSVVLERGDGRAIVEQEAVSHLMMFTRRVHLVLEIVEGPDTLRFRDRSGRSFARYEGMWQVRAEDGQTTILYELTAEPAFDVPEFLLKRLLRRDSGRMIEALCREIAARSAQRPSASPPILPSSPRLNCGATLVPPASR